MVLILFIYLNICRQIYYLFFQIIAIISKNINKNDKYYLKVINLIINNGIIHNSIFRVMPELFHSYYYYLVRSRNNNITLIFLWKIHGIL
jgi:hypothetical protein